MKHYRNQPQASSHVYRSVLLRKKDITKETSGEKSDAGNAKVVLLFINQLSIYTQLKYNPAVIDEILKCNILIIRIRKVKTLLQLQQN